MNNDGVSIAFELIIEELQRVTDDLADQGALAFKERRNEDAQRLSEVAQNLHEFIGKVHNLTEEWQTGLYAAPRQQIEMAEIQHIRSHTKSKKTRLSVKFNNGREIAKNYAADTFALAIKEIGLSRVESLGLTECGVPLVTTKKDKKYAQRQIDGKYVCVHSSTKRKKETLDIIAKQLHLTLKVEIIK